MATKVVTGEVRLSYCNLFEAKTINGGDVAKYSVCLLIPKSDTQQIKQLEDAIQKEIKAETAGKFKNKIKGLKLPLRDGDEDRDGAEYEGHMFINVLSTTKLIIMGVDGAEILQPALNVVYSGCYARVSFNLYAFDVRGNRGVAAGLNAVKKTRDGDNLGGAYTEANTAEDFDDDDLM